MLVASRSDFQSSTLPSRVFRAIAKLWSFFLATILNGIATKAAVVVEAFTACDTSEPTFHARPAKSLDHTALEERIWTLLKSRYVAVRVAGLSSRERHAEIMLGRDHIPASPPY